MQGKRQFVSSSFFTHFASDVSLEVPNSPSTNEQIKSAEFLFLSHSHIDHSGAFEWLLLRGFNGAVVTTKETAKQVAFPYTKILYINKKKPPYEEYLLNNDISVMWGKSGHCGGSAWFRVRLGDESIFFSGDYIENMLAYQTDIVRGIEANYAIIENAYSNESTTQEENRDALISLICRAIVQKTTLLFPVPKYGFGLELLVLLGKNVPGTRINIDEHIWGELVRRREFEDWLKLDFFKEVSKLHATLSDDAQIFFVSDPYLVTPQAQKLAEKIIANGGAVVLAGHHQANTFSDRALKSRYSVHLNKAQSDLLRRLNSFENTLLFHK